MALAIVITVAVAIRLYGIDFGIPYLKHSDEPTNYNVIVSMFNGRHFNPEYFDYPSLLFYIHRIFLEVVYTFGKGFGIYDSPQDIRQIDVLAMGVGQIPNPTIFLLMRLLTVLAGAATVAMVYLCSREWLPENRYSAAVGLTGALFAAFSPTLVENSRYLTPDIWGTLFILSSFWAGLKIYRSDAGRGYLWAGVAAGLAAGSKYVGGLVILVVPIAHILRNVTPGAITWRQFAIDRRVVLAGLVSFLIFLITTPYAVLDIKSFLGGFLGVVTHYSKGHAGMEGDTLRFYARLMFFTEGPVAILAVVGMAYGLFRQTRQAVLAGIFPLVYFVMIADLPVRNARTFMPVLPFLFLFAASFIKDVSAMIEQRRPDVARVVPVLAALLLIALPAVQTAKSATALTIDSNAAARQWIAENLPAGASIVLESYSPYVDPDRFNVFGVRTMISEEAVERIGEGADYLIFSSGMYGRFVGQPERYPEQASRYAELFGKYELVRSFAEGSTKIMIYRAVQN